MVLQGHRLQQGLNGTDLAELKTELAQLVSTIPSSKQHAASSGTAMLAETERFRSDRGLSSAGVVDAAVVGEGVPVHAASLLRTPPAKASTIAPGCASRRAAA
jgi:hypothetical protein